MFVYDKQQQSGSVILGVLVISSLIIFALAYHSQRFLNTLKVMEHIELNDERLAWSKAVAERIDCARTLFPFNSTNICPAGSNRNVLLFDRPLDLTGPEGSLPLGGGWFVKARCSTNDLTVQIAKYTGGQFAKHPLTDKVLNFDHPASQSSSGTISMPMCPNYFGTNSARTQRYTMTMQTHQLLSASRQPDGRLINNYIPCDGTIGNNAEVDDTPISFQWSDPANPTQLSAFGRHVSDWHIQHYRNFGVTQNITSNMNYSGSWGAAQLNPACESICVKRLNSIGGRGVKCDPSASNAWPPPGVMVPDSSASQVVCLCIR